jgi:hypothetical protein
MAALTDAVRDRLMVQLATQVAKARAAEREKLGQELAAALGVPDGIAGEFGWSSLLGMVLGVRSIADLILGTTGVVNQARRRELLTAFGVASAWSQVEAAAAAQGPSLRQALGVDDGPDAFRAHGPSPLDALRNDPPNTADGEAGTGTDRP